MINLHVTDQLRVNHASQKQILNIRQGDSLKEYQMARQELDNNLKKFEINPDNSIYVVPENLIKELIHPTIEETENSMTITIEDVDTLAEEVIGKIEPIEISKHAFLNGQYEIGFTIEGEVILKIFGHAIVYNIEVDEAIKKSKYWKTMNLEHLSTE